MSGPTPVFDNTWGQETGGDGLPPGPQLRWLVQYLGRTFLPGQLSLSLWTGHDDSPASLGPWGSECSSQPAQQHGACCTTATRGAGIGQRASACALRLHACSMWVSRGGGLAGWGGWAPAQQSCPCGFVAHVVCVCVWLVPAGEWFGHAPAAIAQQCAGSVACMCKGRPARTAMHRQLLSVPTPSPERRQVAVVAVAVW